MFIGYIPLGGTDGKKPLEKVTKRAEFYKLEEVQHLNGYGGVLKDNFIMVDVDNADQADILYRIVNELDLECNILKTNRGYHFYFVNIDVTRNAIDAATAIGIRVDIKLGSKNTVVPLKVKGELRTWIKQVEQPQQLPKWLTLVDSSIDFLNLEEGDGRNQKLFNYILTLQSAAMDSDDIKETIRLINKYILKESLAEKEIEIILRDEAFQKPTFYKENKLQYEQLATFLKNNEKIIRIDKVLHIYKDGVYSSTLDDIERILLKYIRNSTKTPRSEVLRYLELLTHEYNQTSPKYILVGNGIYNLESKELEDFDPKLILKNKIKTCYNPAAYSEVTDRTLNKICCHDKNLRLLIEEMVGYTLFRRNELGKCFILTGDGSNGKSTLLEMIINLIGKENISAVPLDELSQRFKCFQLEGKLANIGDDISNKYIEDNSTFKKLVTGEVVNVERKGKDPFDFYNYSKLIFSANQLPRINDLSGGLKRRLIFVPFNATFSKKDKDFDPFIKDKLASNEALEYLLKIALDGLHRLLTNQGFTSSVSSDEVWQEYESINNPVVAFIEDAKIENEVVEDIYRQYQVWCMEAGLKALSKIMFCKELKKRGYNTDKSIRIDGVKKRIFQKVA